MDDFEKAGFTPELTEAMRDLSTVNTGIIQLKKIKESGVYSEELDDLLAKLENIMMPMLVERINDMIRREELLRRGL